MTKADAPLTEWLLAILPQKYEIESTRKKYRVAVADLQAETVQVAWVGSAVYPFRTLTQANPDEEKRYVMTLPHSIRLSSDEPSRFLDHDDVIGEWVRVKDIVWCERLYRIRKGGWLLRNSFEPFGRPAEKLSYREISQDEAITWLLEHAPEAIPGNLRKEANTRFITDTLTVAIPRLSPRQFDCLEALRGLGATNADKKATTGDVALHAEGKTAEPVNFKEPIASLKRQGLVHTQEGRGGGVYLTEIGLQVAERAAQERNNNKL